MKKICILGMLCIFGLAFVVGCGQEDADKAAAPKKHKGPQPTFVSIGTGSESGNYLLTGKAIAELVNRKISELNLRCTVETTSGSVFNINAVMAGNLQFGIAQSDRQWQAVQGKGEWKEKGPQADLRAVFSIYPESVTLVAAVDAGIKNSMDLKGKRVNIGNPGSGLRQNAIDALEAVHIDYKTDMNAEGINASESAGLLQDGRIDAFFHTVSHPNRAIRSATTGRRKVRFAAIAGVDKLLKQYPYYTKSVIRSDLYRGAVNEGEIATFGVKATLVTSARVPDPVVYAVTKEIFENSADFKGMNQVHAHLTKSGMLKGLNAPFHPGALRYYKEAGLK
ncbi:MAG: TAXI family TRAP transporter solute-binding subunit [Desulfobacterales bacterium]|nr:TAXI family TRAP transporter solute-binding subunit [Desulfobacterales bacterium]